MSGVPDNLTAFRVQKSNSVVVSSELFCVRRSLRTVVKARTIEIVGVLFFFLNSYCSFTFCSELRIDSRVHICTKCDGRYIDLLLYCQEYRISHLMRRVSIFLNSVLLFVIPRL